MRRRWREETKGGRKLEERNTTSLLFLPPFLTPTSLSSLGGRPASYHITKTIPATYVEHLASSSFFRVGSKWCVLSSSTPTPSSLSSDIILLVLSSLWHLNMICSLMHSLKSHLPPRLLHFFLPSRLSFHKSTPVRTCYRSHCSQQHRCFGTQPSGGPRGSEGDVSLGEHSNTG